MKKLLALLLVFFLVLSPALAASSRVLPVAYNEHTFGGATRDYTSLAVWEDATDVDLVTPGVGRPKGEVLTCYPDEASYDQTVSMAGATTNASYFRVIRSASPTSKVVFAYTGGTTTVSITENYVRLHDVVLRNTNAATATRSIFLNGENLILTVIGCELGPNTAVSYSSGIISQSTGQTINLWNSYIHEINAKSASSYAIYLTGTTTLNCDNTLISTAAAAVRASGGTQTLVMRNVIARDVTAVYSGTPASLTETTCLMTTGAGTVTYDPIPYLSALDTVAKGQGTSLAATFTDDYRGQTRPSGVAWDIGCDEYQIPSVGGASVFFFSSGLLIDRVADEVAAQP